MSERATKKKAAAKKAPARAAKAVRERAPKPLGGRKNRRYPHSLREIGDHLSMKPSGVSEAAARGWIDLHCESMAEIRADYITSLREYARRGARRRINPDEDRSTRAKAVEAELKAARLAGELAPVRSLTEVGAFLTTTMRTRIMAIASRAAAVVAPLTDAREIERELRVECEEACEDVADRLGIAERAAKRAALGEDYELDLWGEDADEEEPQP